MKFFLNIIIYHRFLTVNHSNLWVYISASGLTKTFQRGDIGSYGVSYKVAFMTTDSVNNKLSCFLVNGTQDAPFGPQTIFPDTTGFTVSRLLSC